MLDLKYLIAGTGRCGTVYVSKLLTSLGISCLHEGIFTAYGLEIAKERIYKNIVLSSNISKLVFPSEYYGGYKLDQRKILGESSYFMVPFLDDSYFLDKTIIHLIRHPYKVISSFAFHFKYFTKTPTEAELEEMEDSFKINHDKILISLPSHIEMELFMFKHYREIYNYQNQLDRTAMYYILCNEAIRKSHNKKLFFKIEEDEKKLLDFVGVDPNLMVGSYKCKKSSAKKNNNVFTVDQLSLEVRERLFQVMKEYDYSTKDVVINKKLFI